MHVSYPNCEISFNFKTRSKKALGSKHNQIPRVITVDKNLAYPSAINELKNNRMLPQNVNL
jgi:hypothetical protein